MLLLYGGSQVYRHSDRSDDTSGICVPPTVTYLPYRVSRSTLTAVGRSPLLARWPGTHSRTLSGIQRAARTVLGVYLKRTCSRVTVMGIAATGTLAGRRSKTRESRRRRRRRRAAWGLGCAPPQKIYEFFFSEWCDTVHSGYVVFKIHVS